MRLLRLLFVALFALVSVSVYGIEPSTQIVVRNGKKVYVHKVEKGHTLYSIAKAYGVTEQQIIDSNEGLSAEKLKIDDIIYIPCIEKKGSKGDQKRNDKEDGKYYYHEVKQGDTFYSIAREYKISVNTLREDNPSVDPSSMSLGTKLRIRRGEVGYATTEEIDRTEQSDKPTSTGPNEYVVQAGDTVYSLSRRAGLTEREFMALNKLRTVNDLKVGMVVLLGSTITEEPAKQTEEQTEEQYPTEQTEEQQGEESQGDDAVSGDEQVPEEVAEEFNRERLSGRSDDNPVPDDDFTFPWFMFGDEGKLEDSFRHAEIDFMELGANNTLKVALMLPFKMKGEVKSVYIDFYRGVLLAMEDLKQEGFSVDLTVFDTQNDARVINDIMSYEDKFLDAQLLIGPVYENELQYVVSHAERENIAVVSPLDDIKTLESPVIFQMQPERCYRYDKVRDLISGDREVITIYASTNDKDFIKEINAEVTSTKRTNLEYVFNRGSYFYSRTSSGARGSQVNLESILRTRNDKTFIIVADSDVDIERILTTLSSTKSKLLDRGSLPGRYDVVGNYKWTRRKNIDPQSFFTNNVSFVVSYHAKRDSETIRVFDGRYVKAFGALPTAYSYRGYDAAMIFCRRMYIGLDDMSTTIKPLTTMYSFVGDGGTKVNKEWVLVRYNDDFTITTK